VVEEDKDTPDSPLRKLRQVSEATTGRAKEMLAGPTAGKAKDSLAKLRDKSSAALSGPTAARAKDKAKDVATDSADRVKSTVDTVTLREFRTELDTTLRKVVEVLCAHEAEIADRRKQIDELKADRDQ